MEGMSLVEGEYYGGEEDGDETPHDPSSENYYFTARTPHQRMVFDGKRMRKAIVRKTVDYNSCLLAHVQNRIYQRDYRDRPDLQSIPSYIVKMETSSSYLENSNNSICTKFVHTSINKVKCPINCVTWTPEGRRLITGASSGEFTLWNGLTFNFETILQAHDTAVRSMEWSHNDQWMVTGDHEGLIKYWQPNMNNVKAFSAHKEAVRDISFAPTDLKFATCSDDVSIKIWDFARCAEESVLTGHGWDVKAVDWHPIISLIASGSKDNLVKLWDPKTAKNVTTLHGHKNTILAVHWNENGNWLLTASRDQLLKLFDLRTMKELQTFRGHKREVTVASWHPIHEDLFASAGYDGTIMYWRVGIEEPQGTMQAHEGSIWDISWHPLGHILCSGSNDHTTKFWCRTRPGDNMKGAFSSNEGSNFVPVSGGPGYSNSMPPAAPPSAPVPAPAPSQPEKYEPSMPTGMFEHDIPSIPGLATAPPMMHHAPPPHQPWGAPSQPPAGGYGGPPGSGGMYQPFQPTSGMRGGGGYPPSGFPPQGPPGSAPPQGYYGGQ